MFEHYRKHVFDINPFKEESIYLLYLYRVYANKQFDPKSDVIEEIVNRNMNKHYLSQLNLILKIADENRDIMVSVSSILFEKDFVTLADYLMEKYNHKKKA